MRAKDRFVRIPQQRRSIEKKARVVEAAYAVFSQNGYNKTSTPEIAHAAGISTGSLYAYFKDKKELFLECFKKYSEDLEARLLEGYESLASKTIADVIDRTIAILIEINNLSRNFRNEVMSLMYLDADVRDCYFQQHSSVISTIIGQLIQRNVITDHGREKVFLAVSLLESVTSEFSNNRDSGLDPESLIKLCKETILGFVERSSDPDSI
jgi:TetR/AcrR family transcriptional regulator, biofilm operon repressor